MVRAPGGFRLGTVREYKLCKADGRRTPVSPSVLADFDCASLYGAFQRLVQRGLCLLVFLLRDSALLVLDFELEDFFFQSFEQQRGAISGLGFRGGGNT